MRTSDESMRSSGSGSGARRSRSRGTIATTGSAGSANGIAARGEPHQKAAPMNSACTQYRIPSIVYHGGDESAGAGRRHVPGTQRLQAYRAPRHVQYEFGAFAPPRPSRGDQAVMRNNYTSRTLRERLLDPWSCRVLLL